MALFGVAEKRGFRGWPERGLVRQRERERGGVSEEV